MPAPHPIPATAHVELLTEARGFVPKALRARIDALLAGDPLARLAAVVGADKLARCTPGQRSFLLAFLAYRDQRRMSPTLAELGTVLGVTKVSVYGTAETLVGKGVLRKVPNVARGLELAAA